jgi:hypothetical protein
MKFIKAILALYLASLSLAAPQDKPDNVKPTKPSILGRGLVGTPSPSLLLIESELDRTQNRSPRLTSW